VYIIIIKYCEAVEKNKHGSRAEIFIAHYISFSLALNLGSFPLNFSPLLREMFL
jgi:hypothetical protein